VASGPECSPWAAPSTVAGFATAPPNETLRRYAAAALPGAASRRLLDIGCGAGRNAVPLAQAGWRVVGCDVSWPMLYAAAAREPRVHLVFAPMDALPLQGGSVDLMVAHGIWNLARSGREFRAAVAEAARVARQGATLFVFTFSRTTLPAAAEPVAGEPFVFTQFSGEPQCFVTEAQLIEELRAAGFAPDPALPLRELNRPRPGAIACTGTPVIYEGGFRRL
jgi:SAM-dependent methyltransferase